jgi:hypothetical protein
MTLVKVILNQNYFQYNDELYTQNEGLAIGAPTSSIFAEIFVQCLEHNYIIKILQKHHVMDYYRYADDVLIVYNDEHTNIQDTLQDFSNTSIHPNIQDTYPISIEHKQEEPKIINTIMHNNGYTIRTLTRKKRKQINKTPIQTRKLAVFTYAGRETRTITKLFRNTNIHIAYKTRNTVQKHLQMKNVNPDKYSQSGVYEIKCNSCSLKYIRQTGRNFRTRFKEHIHAIRTNKTTSKYAQHILEIIRQY